MSGFHPSFSWPMEPEGAVDKLATFVDCFGVICFTGPGGLVELEDKGVYKVGCLGRTKLRGIASGALVASKNDTADDIA